MKRATRAMLLLRTIQTVTGFIMQVLFIILLSAISTQLFAFDGSIEKFETDYCTNYMEGTRANPTQWKHCCLLHDMYFWAGGNFEDRNASDLELKICIEKTGARKQAQLMYYAVRLGSYSPIKYPKRKWNNGWIDGRSPRALSIEDIEIIQDELHSGYDFINSSLKDQFLASLKSRLD
jgi:hypothetical protein